MTARAEAQGLLKTASKAAAPPEPDSDEIEAQALLDGFDGRITEIEQRVDRVLARLHVG